MNYGFLGDIKSTMCVFSETVEEQLLVIERGRITDKESLRDIFNQQLSSFFVRNEITGELGLIELLTKENCEIAAQNAEVSKDKMYAAGFNLIHIEPVLAMADILKKAGLDSEADSVMTAYSFALGMRQLYRKLLW